MFKTIRELLHSGKLVGYIVGQSPKNTTRPEEDAQRWIAVIEFYRKDAEQTEKFIMKNMLLEMFSSKDRYKQLPALIIGRRLKFSGLKLKIIESIQNGMFYTFDKSIQESVLISAIFFQAEEIIDFVLDALLERKRIVGLVTWTDTPHEEIPSEDDIWRIRILARYYERSELDVRKQIEQQLYTLPDGNQLAQNILAGYLKRCNEFLAFESFIRIYLVEKGMLP